MEMEASGLQGGLVSGTPCDTHPAEQEANQLRSRYIADEEEAATNNTNRSSSETGRSYVIVDRWRGRGRESTGQTRCTRLQSASGPPRTYPDSRLRALSAQ